MYITEKDVGRKVVLQNGNVEFIDRAEWSLGQLGFQLSNNYWHGTDGLCFGKESLPSHERHIKRFADDTEIKRTPETTTTKDKLLELLEDLIAAKNYSAAHKMIDAIELLEK